MKGKRWTCPHCGGWSFADKNICHHCFLARPWPYRVDNANGAAPAGKAQGKGKGPSKAVQQIAEAEAAAKKQKAASKKLAKKAKKQQASLPDTGNDRKMAKQVAELTAKLQVLEKEKTASLAKASTAAEEAVSYLQIALPELPVVEDDYIFKRMGLKPVAEAQPLALWCPFPTACTTDKTPEEEVEELCKATDNVKALELRAAEAKKAFEKATEIKLGDQALTILEESWKEEEEETLSAARKKDGSGRCLASIRRAEVDLACKETARVTEFQRLQAKSRERVQTNVTMLNSQVQAIIARRDAYVRLAAEADKAHLARNAVLVERSEQRLAALKTRLPPGQGLQPPSQAADAQSMEVTATQEVGDRDDFLAQVQWNYAEIPTITETTAPEKLTLATLAHNLGEWLQFGGSLRFSYAQLLNEPADFRGSMVTLAKLLGPVMHRLYSARDPTGEDIVPNALGFPLQAALCRLDPVHLTIAQPAKEVLAASGTKTLKVLQKKRKLMAA